MVARRVGQETKALLNRRFTSWKGLIGAGARRKHHHRPVRPKDCLETDRAPDANASELWARAVWFRLGDGAQESRQELIHCEPLRLPNGSRLSCGALKKDSFP